MSGRRVGFAQINCKSRGTTCGNTLSSCAFVSPHIRRNSPLDLGADDYLSKPFSLGELLARLRSLLRQHTGVKQTSFQLRGLKLDLLSQSVYLNERLIEVTSREYALLEIFMQNPGRTLPRNVICEKIWESHRDVDRNLLDVYMSRLRTKLDTGPGEPFFRTVYGVGYKFA